MSRKFISGGGNNHGSKNGNMIKGRNVEVRDDFGRALRIFTKKIQDTGMLREVKERMHYEPKCTVTTRMKKAARKRWEKKVENMISSGEWGPSKPY